MAQSLDVPFGCKIVANWRDKNERSSTVARERIYRIGDFIRIIKTGAIVSGPDRSDEFDRKCAWTLLFVPMALKAGSDGCLSLLRLDEKPRIQVGRLGRNL